MESVDFLFHLADHDVVEKSLFVSDIPSSEMKFEAGLSWDSKAISTANEKLDSFLEEIFNKQTYMDETDIYVFPFDSEVESADDTQISDLVIWIDTIAFTSGGHV